MFDATAIKAAFLSEIGWRQNIDSSGWQLNSLTDSSTGHWYNDVHPMLTFDNLRSICPRFERVFATQPEVNAAFTNWLTEKTGAAIIAAIEAWIGTKSGMATAKNLLAASKLFSTTGNIQDSELSSDKVVGFELDPVYSPSLLVTIREIGLQLTEDQILGINLFQSGIVDPIEVEPFDYSGSGSLQWLEVNWSLKSDSKYWLVYDQRDLSGYAINGIRNFTFQNGGLSWFPAPVNFVKITALNTAIDSADILWDLSKNTYTLSTNYGINLKLDVRCDYTDFIIDQKRLFTSLIKHQVGINLLRELAFNPESNINRHESNISRQQLIYEIEGDTQGRNQHTLSWGFKQAMDAIQFDREGIDAICLPCKRRGIRYKTIGPR